MALQIYLNFTNNLSNVYNYHGDRHSSEYQDNQWILNPLNLCVYTPYVMTTYTKTPPATNQAYLFSQSALMLSMCFLLILVRY